MQEISATTIIRMIDEGFNKEDLLSLCFLVEYGEYDQSTEKKKIMRELVGYFIRQGKVEELLKAIEKENPNVYKKYIKENYQKRKLGMVHISFDLKEDAVAEIITFLSKYMGEKITVFSMESSSIEMTFIASISGIHRLLSGIGQQDPELEPLNIKDAGWVAPTLRNADLKGAYLREADLHDADLYGANLSGANLRYADLSNSDLRKSDLIDADLYGANLSGANLRGANMTRSDLSGADLTRADIRGAILDGVISDGQTQWPWLVEAPVGVL